MKKCPKCGTILDDSKKKCYMCGSDIQKKNPIDFMAGFDDQIGAAVTKGQDNVFNKVPDISVKINEVVNKSTNNATFSSGSSSADFFKNQVNNSPMQFHDDRTSIEKMFSNDSRFKTKNEVNAKDAMKKNSKKNDSSGFVPGEDFFGSRDKKPSKMPTIPAPEPPPTVNLVQQMKPSAPPVIHEPIQQNNNFTPVVPKETPKPAINWGNNLSNNNNNSVSSFKDNVSKKMNLNFSFIFNTVCFLLFLGGFIFIYFKYIKDDTTGRISMGGLNYTIDGSFKLKTDDNFSKYYTYGDDCVVRISYGSTADVDSFVDSYYEDVQKNYSSDNGYITQLNEMRINGNVWSEILVAQLGENPAGTGGFSTSAKYRFVTIVYKGNFYEIRYVNLDSDNKCSAMYDSLVNSLEFE